MSTLVRWYAHGRRFARRAAILGLLCSTACSTAGRRETWASPSVVPAEATATSSVARERLLVEGQTLFEHRDDRASLEQAISIWERLIALDPTQGDALVRLSRAYDFLAEAHLALDVDGDVEPELSTYERGVSAAERALLVLDPEFERALRAGTDFKDAVRSLSPQALPAAYWYAVNLGRFASKKGLSVRLFYKDRLRATMDRVRELDPRFFHAGVDRYFGAFYVALPSIAGKDVDKARRAFEAAESAAPDFLGTRVVMAQFLAIELDDRALYERLLTAVLDAPEGEDPDIVPENRAAKRVARSMLLRIDERF